MWRYIFVLIFSSIYFLMNYYVFSRISWFFWLKKNSLFYGIVLFMTFFFPFIMSLNRLYHNPITKYLYFFASIWMWVLVLSIGILLSFEVVNLILKYWFKYNLINNVTWYVIILLIISFSSYAIWNWKSLEIKTYDLPIKNLAKDMRIIYLSDIHVDTINGDEYLKKIVDQVNLLSWDLVVINWDLVDSLSLTEHSFKTLNDMIAPVVFTYWNHETYVWKELVNDLLKNTKVQILENQMIEFNWMQIIWLQDMNWFDNSTNKVRLENLLKRFVLDDSKPSILVLHQPIAPSVSARFWIDLQVAWHTHNWQIFPFMFLVKMAFPYINWLYNVDGMHMYVGSWTWSWGPPMRLWSRPLITILNLIKQSE